MSKSTFRNISKAIHNGFYTDSDINSAISEYKRNGAPISKVVSLHLKKFFHRNIKHVIPKTRRLLLAEKPAILAMSESPASSKEILLISHEMTLTGAPRALLTFAITLKSLGYSPAILSLSEGPLTQEANRHGIPVMITESELVNPYVPNTLYKAERDVVAKLINRYSTVIYNTIVSVDILNDFINRSNSFIWIHEAGISYRYLRSNRDKIISALNNAKKIWIVGEHAKKMFDTYTHGNIDSSIFLYGIPPIDADALCKIKPVTLEADKIHIMMSGMMGHRKGTNTLLKAVDMLTDIEQERIKVHLIGGCCENNTRKEINNAPDTVKWWGEKSHEELLKIMGQMQALICPSIDDPMPIVCTEAFQQNIPVATSDATGTAALITTGESGMVFPADNPEALAEVIRTIINMPTETLKEIGRNGKNIYDKNFTLEVFTRHVVEYFPPITSQTHSKQ